MRIRVVAVLTSAFMFAFIGGSAVAGTWAHWGDNEPGFPRGYAYVQDLTGSAWPVYTAAISWDQAPKLDLVYRTGANGCAHCFDFDAIAMGGAGCSPVAGETWPGQTGGHINNNTWSHVDSGCASATYNARLELVCHEMGHAIGLLDRVASAASCMRTNTGLGGQVDGSAADFTDLNTAYSHDS